MAALQASLNSITATPCPSSSTSFDSRRRFAATLRVPRPPKLQSALPKIQSAANLEERTILTEFLNPAISTQVQKLKIVEESKEGSINIDMATTKLHAIAEAVADRAEMHASICEQRNNWNILLTNSINAITLTAATMAGLSLIPTGVSDSLSVMKLTSTLLYTAATGLLLVVNKIQPSQLAEEQRNATRLFRQLHDQIRTTLALRTPTPLDVDEVMEKVLALDRAYPLPLLPGMLEKFPATVEPARWWPLHQRRQTHQQHLPTLNENGTNGWNQELEEEMRGVLGVLKRKDTADYVRLSKLVLKINRILAASGPLLTGLAALGTLFMGSPSSHGSWAALVGVAGGALASVVNTFEHGGQVGMVFELYRSCAGFYRFLEERIESNLNERDWEKRENGEMFEMKVAIELGRSIQELRDLASASKRYRNEDRSSSSSEEFAGKLF